jgi:hypothetical protein
MDRGRVLDTVDAGRDPVRRDRVDLALGVVGVGRVDEAHQIAVARRDARRQRTACEALEQAPVGRVHDHAQAFEVRPRLRAHGELDRARRGIAAALATRSGALAACAAAFTTRAAATHAAVANDLVRAGRQSDRERDV